MTSVLSPQEVKRLIRSRPTDVLVFFYMEQRENWGKKTTTRADIIRDTQLSENTVDQALNSLAEQKLIAAPDWAQ